MYDSGTNAPTIEIIFADVGPQRATRTLDLTRAMDVVFTLAALIFLAPLMLFTALAIYFSDPGPVLFRHRRIGRGGVGFGCLKFRSMVVDSEARLAELLARSPAAREEWGRDHKLRNDPRVTRLGAFLRASSLDELPQLFNVLSGEMSLVGPRPIVDGERSRYSRYFAHYCAVKPGISGLWQVSGRSDTTYRRRVACDVLYARRKSPIFDLKIMVMTVPAILAAKGAR